MSTGTIFCSFANCTTTFQSRAALRRHVRNLHNAVKDSACPLCPRRFRDRYNLNTHMRTHRNSAESQAYPADIELRCYLCDLCLGVKSFYTHMQWHARDLQAEHQAIEEKLKGYLKCLEDAEDAFDDD